MNTKTIALPANVAGAPMQEEWTEVIVPRSRLLDLRLGELWRYRDLVLMLVRRDFVANYKQTMLGPLWFLLQPILTTLIFTFILGRVAGTYAKSLPQILFYLAVVSVWNIFSETLNKTAIVFRDNAHLCGNVLSTKTVLLSIAFL